MTASFPYYAIATGLKGFGIHTTLRVKVQRIEHGNVFVRTADLADAGTPLVLSEAQVEPERPIYTLSHKSGLVQFV